jgi:hypothetical protein
MIASFLGGIEQAPLHLAGELVGLLFPLTVNAARVLALRERFASRFGHFLHVLQQSAAKLAGSWSRTGVRYVKSGHAHRPLSSYFHVGADQTLSSRARLPSSIKFDERPAILLRELKLLSARREGP